MLLEVNADAALPLSLAASGTCPNVDSLMFAPVSESGATSFPVRLLSRTFAELTALSATFAVVYGFAAALLVYRSIGVHSAWVALRDAALTAGMVLFMVATSNLLSQAIVIDGLGRTLAKAFTALHSPTEFLLVTVVVMIVVGFILEGIPAILIAAPILLPIATRVGVDPLQYGIVLTMAVGIGVFLPPVGIGYYVACAIGEAPVNATMRPSYIYNAVLVLGLILVVLLPQITVWLPHVMGLN